MLPENNNQINQTSNYLDNILNSTSPITPEILFESVDKCKKDEQDKLKLLLEKAFEQGINIDILKEPNKYTLLYDSITKNLQEVATFLLEKGGSPNIQDWCSYTPLHYIIMAAYGKYRIEIVELLIKKCTNLELKDLFDLTFIQEAVRFNNKEATQLLIQYGANIDIKVSNNKSMHHKKNLIELAEDKPILKALLTLTKACKDNDFSIVDNIITTKDIAEFIDWQLSITPENSRFFDKHLRELHNFKDFLKTKPELVSGEAIQKLNEYITSYSIVGHS
ncbi:MAG: ankyrin repeat domain-containing protein [Rickettsia endosymbiont of Stiretrus anchorago]|nr:ankyrin repeat domain-containing protein [Rickettsia endosymbiont of Stiretrus anchorago]